MNKKLSIGSFICILVLALVSRRHMGQNNDSSEKKIIFSNGTNEGLRKERSKGEIIRDMLSVTMEEKKAKKTRIMQKTYLNLTSFRKYFDLMIKDGFITYCNSENGFYELTDKGKDLLNRLKEVDELMPSNGNAAIQQL